ncbi:hypothetical protein ABNF97_06815 [Plantactinospora sp. B6F1]|uniref:WXG100 family type VII secretion target n=1 Tax=Plantactinospora sp. B6F1 TaxID=3158971 RepID=UPI0032D8BAA7
MAPVAAADLWDLGASPGTLQEYAAAWRQAGQAAENAATTVGTAARQTLHEEGWAGDSADSYAAHQSRVTADLDAVAGAATSVADALDYLAGVLAFNQELLLTERGRLSGIRSTGQGADLAFHPADETQAALVRDSIASAREIRARVDDEIALKKATFSTAYGTLAAIEQTWRPRTIGMLNLNIGQGYKNEPFNSEGTDRGDMDLIAQIIAGSNVEVATLQEVFGSDVERLERELRERTGDDWTIYFGEASEKPYWSDGIRPVGLHEPFGNAIAVRHGDAIAGSAHTDTIKLDVPGSVVSGGGPPTDTTTPAHPPPGTIPDPSPHDPVITDGEGRSATEVRIDFRPTGGG